MFVDRTWLVSLVNQLVSVRGGPDVGADDSRPVLIVEGSGGSGRSTFLQEACNKWSGRTPIASIDPRRSGRPDAQGMRPVLLAVMLALSAEVPGYRVWFPRVIAAHIAMREPITEEDPQLAKEIMLRRLVQYRDRRKLIDLVGEQLPLVGDAVQNIFQGHPAAEVAPALARVVAPRVADFLQRSPLVIKGRLGKAVEWFRHQDRGLNFDPLVALVHLSNQATIETEAVRQDVDELLVAALLADLRESLDGLENRPANALVLLDNADMPSARAFITALLRVQGRVPDPLLGQAPRPSDPLVVVTASGGGLAEELPQPHRQPIRRFQLGDFTEEDVRTMAQKRMWPPTLGSATISRLTYRLTGGHAMATGLVLRALESNPAQLNDLDSVLRDQSFTAPDTLEDHLLDRIVSGLRADGKAIGSLRHDLITLTAARDVNEAESLTELLQSPAQELLFTSTILWSGRQTALPPLDPPTSAPSQLSPLIRYLGLRALAARTEDDAPTWDTVFNTLRERVTVANDPAARLHHELALGNQALVVAELTELLHNLPNDRWLSLLDQITATPNPSRCFAMSGNEPTQPTEHTDVIDRIVEGQHAVSDPRLSDPETLNHLYSRLSNDFGHLAGNSRMFLKRATYYAQLANRLA